MSRRLVAGAVVALVLLAGLVAVGRWERGRNADAQNARMRAAYRAATSDGLYSHRLDKYRLAYRFDCLLYAEAGRPSASSAYELCFDSQGRLVQTVDRHTGTPVFGSLLEQPSLAAIRVPVPRLVGIFEKLGLFRRDPRLAGTKPDPSVLPLADDIGAFLVPRRPTS